jgi:hypothetical protein
MVFLYGRGRRDPITTSGVAAEQRTGSGACSCSRQAFRIEASGHDPSLRIVGFRIHSADLGIVARSCRYAVGC